MNCQALRVRRLTVRRASVVVACWVVVTQLAMVSAHGTGPRLGDAVVVAHPGSNQKLGGGGSRTLFSLRLPNGASCPGDSANDGYRIQGFMVPANDDPGKLRYEYIQPEGEGRWGLFDEYTNSYAQILTAKQDAPGGPGLVLEIPRFTFAVFPPGMVRPGNYRIGIACTLLNETVHYWDSEFRISSDASDEPSEIHWNVVGFKGNEGRTVSTTVTIALGSAAIALVALGLGVRALKIRKKSANHAAGSPGNLHDL